MLRSSLPGEERGSPLLSVEASASGAKRAAILAGEPSYLERIALELWDTERAYVNDLHDIIQAICPSILVSSLVTLLPTLSLLPQT